MVVNVRSLGRVKSSSALRGGSFTIGFGVGFFSGAFDSDETLFCSSGGFFFPLHPGNPVKQMVIPSKKTITSLLLSIVDFLSILIMFVTFTYLLEEIRTLFPDSEDAQAGKKLLSSPVRGRTFDPSLFII